MPETLWTDYCGKTYRLVQHTHDFVLKVVVPAIDLQVRSNPAANFKRNNAIQVTYVRIIRWLMTVDILNKTHYFQATGAAARGVFELYLDLKWLEKFPQPEYLERFCAYPDVSRYMAAKRAVEHKKQNSSSNVDITRHQKRMAELDAVEPMADKVARIWGTDPSNGKPLWPRDHWSGKGKLPSRTKLLGPDCEDLYVGIYPTLCALLHPGPGPEVKDSLNDLTWMEDQTGFAYFYTYLCARLATVVTCEMLDARRHIPNLDFALQRLDEWEQEARQAMPPP